MHWQAIVTIVVIVVMSVVITVARGIERRRQKEGQPKESAPEGFPYVLRDPFLTPAELSFYHALRLALPADRQILVKPRLADLVGVAPGLSPGDHRRALNRVSQKHADFVICTLDCAPELVIELDDRSHRQADRTERDDLVDGIYRAVGMPVVHQVAQHSYSVEDLRSTLAKQRKTRMAGNGAT